MVWVSFFQTKKKLQKTFSGFFKNALNQIGINTVPSKNPVDVIIQKFKNRPRLKLNVVIYRAD